MRPTWPSIIPLGATTWAPARGLGERGAGVDLQRGVVVDVAVLVEHAAVAVVGVLVDAQVGDQHDVVADVAAQVGEGELHDALGIEGAGADGVLACRDPEQHDGPHAERGQLGDLLAEALAAVLDDARQRHDRLRLGDALADEQRGDQVARAHRRLGDEVAEGRRAPEAPRPVDGERSACHRPNGTRPSPCPSWARSREGGGEERRRRRPASGAAATWVTATPAGAGGVGGDRAEGDDDGRHRGAQRVDPAGDRRAAGEHDGVDTARAGRARRASGGGTRSGTPSPTRPGGPSRASPSASSGRARSAWASRMPARRRRELGQQALGPGHAPGRGRPAGRPPAASAAADAGPTAASRTAGCRRAAAPTRRAPLADVTTSQSNAASRASAPRRATPPSAASPISISGTCTTVAPSSARRSPSSPGVGPGHGDAHARRGGVIATPTARLAARAAAGPARGRRRRARARRRRGRRRPGPSAARNTCSTPSATCPPTGSEHPEPSSARKLRSTSTAWRVAGVVDGGRAARRSPRRPARDLDGDAALPDGGHELLDGQALGDPVGQPEHLQRGDGHHDRPVRRAPCSSRVAMLPRSCDEVAGPGGRRRAGPAGAPSRWRPWRPRRQPVERAPDQRVGGVPPTQERADRQGLVGDRREVLGRVHGDVGPAVEHGLLDLLDEHALAADRRAAARPGGGRRSSRRAPARRRSPSPAAARRRRPGPACGPAGCRGWPGARAVSTRSLSAGRRGRSRRPRCARPCGVPASWRRRTDGPCRSLATMVRVSASTASRSVSSRSARRPAKRASSRAADLLGLGVQLGDERGGLAGRDLDAEALDLLGDDRAHPVGLARRAGRGRDRPSRAGRRGRAAVTPSSAADGAVDGAGHGDVDDQQRVVGALVAARRRRRVTTLCPDAVQATTTSHVGQRPRRRGRDRGPGRRRARPARRRARACGCTR